VDKIDKFKIKNQDLTDSFMPGREKVFGAILDAAKQHAKSKDNRDQLRAMLEGGTMAAMDTGKVEMRKAPGAKKAEEALSTAADFIPFVGAGKSAMQGDYGSAALQAGMDVAGGPLLKGAAALGGKFLAPALMGAIKAKDMKAIAPQDEALRIAEQKGVEMLGLPPGNTPMDRARAMGYDTPAYHATQAEFDKFKKNKVTPYGDRFFFSPDAEYANQYADLDSAIAGNTQRVKDWKVKNSGNAGPNVMPVLLKNDGFRDWTHISPEYVVTDPKNVRSRFAAFDPSRIHENDLLAGVGALGIGLPLASGLADRDEGYAHGGEVHAANGLPLTFAYDKEDPDALQNWMRENQFGKVDIPAPYKVTPEEVTVARAMRTPAPEMSAKDKLRTLLQEGVKQGKKEVKTLGDPNAVTDLVNRGLIANNPVSGAIDLVNMGLEPFGLGSEMPIGGSAHVQKLMKDYGLTKQERPLLETGLALASPFMPAAAKATEGMTAGLAIKPVGGQWLSGNRGPKSVGEFRARDDAINPEGIQRRRDVADASRQNYELEPTEVNRRLMETSRAVLEGAERRAAVNNWIDSNLQNYLRKQMGTPDDPVLKLAEEGVLHMPHRDVPLMSDVSRAREIAGFPALGTATTDLGRMWENLTDAQIASINAGTLRDPKAMREIFDQRMAMDQNLRGNRVPGQPETLEEKSRAWDWGSAPAIVQSIREQNPWLEKLNPDEMVYRMRNRGDLGETLGVDHIIDVLREDMVTGRIRPEQLSKMSMEQAVRRTAEYDAERAAAMAKASAEEMKGMTIAKEFEDGYKMVQLDKPGQFAKESDRMGHSVRGYEPSKGHEDWSEASGNSGYSTYGHGGWDSIKSGETQVFSLRDSKNKPHVTVEVFRTDYVPNKDVEEMLKRSGIEGEPAKAYMLKHGVIDERGNLLPDDPNAVTHKITQIKGKQNAAPNEEYLPMIQRFIREGGYEVEGDLGNTGLIDARSSGMGKQWEYDKKFYYPDMPAYMTESEFNRWRSTGEFTPDQHFGEGGMKRGGRVKSDAFAAADTGKVEMRKAPGAKKAEEALSTAAEFIPFVGAGKAAAEGDYGSAALQAGMDVAGGPLLKGAAALGGKFLAPALAGAIKAYHGSPYKFDKFDMSKIGTGEGAQAYGHGLYFAESPRVAADYKKNVTASKQYDFWTDEIRAKLPKALTNKEFDELGKLSQKMFSGLSPNEMSRWRELKDINANYDNAVKELTPTGNLYETNLRWPDAAREAADPLSPHHFLDYDKPLSEQSDYVKSMLSVDKRAKDKLYGSGAEYYRGLTGRYAQDAPIHFSAEQAEEKFGMPLASQQLKALGIPGIRYKDAGSRSNFRVQTSYKGEPYGEPVSFMTEQQALDYAKEQKEKGFGADVMPGTSNYVLFSDELADILKRNDEQLKAIGGYATKSVKKR